jgi:hypothetical protein
MNNTIQNSVKVNESAIRLVAYQMWQTAGHPAGSDLQFWLDAEKQLRASTKVAPRPPAAQLSAVNSKSGAAPKSVQPHIGPSQPNSPTPQQKKRTF